MQRQVLALLLTVSAGALLQVHGQALEVHPQGPIAVQSGDSFTLECSGKVNDLLWARNNVTLLPKLNKDGRTKIDIIKWKEEEQDLYKSKLEVYDMQPSDAGVYVCAKNQADLKGIGFATSVLIVIVDTVDAVVGEVGDDVTVSCTVPQSRPFMYQVYWYRAEANTTALKPGDRYEMSKSSNNASLTIKNARLTDTGKYICEFKGEQAARKIVNVFGKPFVYNFDPSSKNLVQGDPLSLNCRIHSHPPATISWFRNSRDTPVDFSDPRISLHEYKGIENATLKIKDLEFDDRAEYICSAENSYGPGNNTVLVRVKDKLAALWPFLGICCEVIILCTIIFIYEKHRAKKMEEEEDVPDEAGHLTNSHDHKGKEEIRQRK